MKSTKVQTLGAVALHATTACTEDARLKYFWLRSTTLGYSEEEPETQALDMHVYTRIYKSNIDRRYAHMIAFATHV